MNAYDELADQIRAIIAPIEASRRENPPAPPKANDSPPAGPATDATSNPAAGQAEGPEPVEPEQPVAAADKEAEGPAGPAVGEATAPDEQEDQTGRSAGGDQAHDSAGPTAPVDEWGNPLPLIGLQDLIGPLSVSALAKNVLNGISRENMGTKLEKWQRDRHAIKQSAHEWFVHPGQLSHNQRTEAEKLVAAPKPKRQRKSTTSPPG